MVTVRHSHTSDPRPQGTAEWLAWLGLPDKKIACLLDMEKWLAGQGFDAENCAQLGTGWEMVEILADLRMDKDALLAALLFPLVEAHMLDPDQLCGVIEPSVQNMLAAVRQMEAIRSIPVGPNQMPNAQQAENLRKMLLTMVEDVRGVVIKLAAQI